MEDRMERERSPNYPAYGLEGTIVFARGIYSKMKRVPADMDMIAKALGSKGVSGPVRSKVAAMRHYGLLEGDQQRLKVSDRAMALIMRKPGDPEYDAAAREAAIEPQLFRTLAQRAASDDEALQWFLMQELRFSEAGAKRAVRSFRATASFAKLETSEYNTGSDEEERAVLAAIPPNKSQAVPAAALGEPRSDEIVVKVRGVFDGSFDLAELSPRERIEAALEILELITKRYKNRPEPQGSQLEDSAHN